MRPIALTFLAAAGLVHPAAAGAGPVSARAARDSGCPAPLQQLSASKTKEVTARVEAAVEVVKAGTEVSASSTVASDTVLMAQDDVAKAWAVYAFCRQLETGLITQDLYVQFVLPLKGSTQPVASTSSTESPAPPVALAAATGGVTSAALSGRWVVTVKEKRSSCGKSRGLLIYDWMGEYDSSSGFLTFNASGAGTSNSFPILTGRLDGVSLRLTGLKADKSAKVDYFLEAGPGGVELTGDMLMASGAEQPPCAYEATVTATRP